MRTHLRFLVLLVLFAAGVLAQGAALPVMEGSDESLHSTYTELMRREQRLPDRATFRENSTRQESGQPPLTYWLAAQVAALLGLPSTDGDALLAHLYTVRNDWLTPPDAWNRRDNLNHYFHGDDERAFNAPNIVRTNRVLRFTSLVYGVLSVIGAYGTAREVFVHNARPRGQSWALTATALFAFMPTMIHISAYLTNDISGVMFATLATWQALRVLRLGATPTRMLLIGTLLALGALSKVSVLLVAPGMGVALLLDWWQHRYSLARLVGNAVLPGVPMLVVFAPWVAWGAVHYGDPFGVMTHYHPTLSYDGLLPFSQLLTLMPEIYLSYWAKFGLAKVYLHPVTYTLFGALLLLSLIGGVTGISRRHATLSGVATVNGKMKLVTRQGIVLGVVGLVVFAGLVRWTQEIAIITGRLLYPAHVVVALGLAGGLYGLAQRVPRMTRPLQGFAVGLMCVAGVILSPVAIHQAYREPVLLSVKALPALEGGTVDFEDTIRLLGYTQESARLDGTMHTITLCWEVLRVPERAGAFSLKLVRDGVIVADRTSTHGLGHYPSALWTPGARFCDAVDLPYDDPDVPNDPLPEPGTVYDMLVVMLDAESKAVDWEPRLADGSTIQFPVIGQVISPAGDLSADSPQGLTGSDVQFPGFAAVQGYRLVGTVSAGETLDLSLLWHVTETTAGNWTQFVHLVGADGSRSLADGTPRGGAYPTWAWAVGERITDTWRLALSDDLAPGAYTLEIGFYRRDTGERMPVTVGGTPAPDNAAPLVTIQLE